MKCDVCGAELHGSGQCPVCGFKSVAVVGNMSDELKKKFKKAADDYKKQVLEDVKVYLRIYYWKEDQGKLVEKSHEDLLVGDRIHDMAIEQVNWGKTQFAKQTGGDKLSLTVIVKEGSDSKTKNVSVIAPNTEDFWNVGIVLKPALKAVIRVGDEKVYSDTEEISLK